MSQPSTVSALKFLTVPAKTKHTATIIFVHGLGDSGHGWQPVAEMLQKDAALAHIKWVLPHAPERPVTVNGGMVVRSWFDIYSFTDKSKEDEKGMLESVAALRKLVDAEVAAGIQPNRIVLGGFSQGSVLSLLAGLTTDVQLAGVIALSGRVPLQDKFKGLIIPEAKSKPIFWGHGEADELIKFAYAKESVELLKDAGLSVTNGVEAKGLSFNSYPGVGHSLDMKELNDVKSWILQVLPQ